MSLNKRIQILLAFLVGVPFLLLLFESYRNGRASLLQQMRSDAVHTAQFQSALVNDLFSLPRQTAKDLARILAVDDKLSQETIKTLLRRTLQETKETEGFSVALFDGRGPGRPFIPYVCWKNGKVEEMFLEAEAYGYLKQPWATRPVAEKRGIWSDPYFDQGGGETLMITYSTPILREGRIVGLVTADVALDQMVARLAGLKPGGSGHVYMVSPEGAVLAHPTLGKLLDTGMGKDSPDLGVLKSMLAHEGEDTTSAKDPLTKQQAWLVEVPLANLATQMGGPGWSLIVSWPEEMRTKPLSDMGKRFLVLYLALGGAALLFLNRSLNDMISQPIARLVKQAQHFAHGDFGDLGHPPEEAPELRDLGLAVQQLGATLKEGHSPKPPKAGA